MQRRARLGGFEKLIIDAGVAHVVDDGGNEGRCELEGRELLREAVLGEDEHERLHHVRRVRAVVIRALGPARADTV